MFLSLALGIKWTYIEPCGTKSGTHSEKITDEQISSASYFQYREVVIN